VPADYQDRAQGLSRQPFGAIGAKGLDRLRERTLVIR
jgi:hypothetical protein